MNKWMPVHDLVHAGDGARKYHLNAIELAGRIISLLAICVYAKPNVIDMTFLLSAHII